jgi:uncharacterized pyridoxamine 5'-phosphate oxidase family protein
VHFINAILLLINLVHFETRCLTSQVACARGFLSDAPKDNSVRMEKSQLESHREKIYVVAVHNKFLVFRQINLNGDVHFCKNFDDFEKLNWIGHLRQSYGNERKMEE